MSSPLADLVRRASVCVYTLSMMLPGMASGASCQSKQEQDKKDRLSYALADLNRSDLNRSHLMPGRG